MRRRWAARTHDAYALYLKICVSPDAKPAMGAGVLGLRAKVTLPAIELYSGRINAPDTHLGVRSMANQHLAICICRNVTVRATVQTGRDSR